MLTALTAKRLDGTFVGVVQGYPYHIVASDPLYPTAFQMAAEMGTALQFEPTPAPPTLEQVQAIARLQVVALIDAKEALLTGGVPANERASWSAKEAAARSWLADQAQPVPVLIAAEAAVVGETALAVAQRIVARADAWLPVTGAHTGHRRVAEAAIAAAETPAAVQAALDALREALA